jgi:arginyl-tRNA synthetase
VRVKDRLTRALQAAVSSWSSQESLAHEGVFPIELEIPKNRDHGDYASNVALILGSKLKWPPRKVAEALLSEMAAEVSFVDKVEVAGPGFMNFYLKREAWYGMLREVEGQGGDYGRVDVGEGRRVQVEYVSANPTGPLHIGHGRGAAVGDALASVLEKAGYAVEREYYVNDIGKQMDLLGQSVYMRYLQLKGREVTFPTDGYQGDYIVEVARRLASRSDDDYLAKAEDEAIAEFSSYARTRILEGIRKDLEDFGVRFDRWFSEGELFESEAVNKAIESMRKEGLVYEKDGATWLRTSELGDDKDRVVVRANGDTTYFASDIAYHRDKFERGFDTIINVWGADHHGYIPRMEAVVQALGKERGALKVLLVQMVSLQRDGVPVAMSTRSGEFTALREVLDEVGTDAARYIFLTRRSDAPLEFDLELAKRHSDENPVYYVQYAHARICQIIGYAGEKGFAVPPLKDIEPRLLELPEEMALVKQVLLFPEVIEGSARALEPHRITIYLHDLVSQFHNYYHKGKLFGGARVVTGDAQLTLSRLWLVNAIRTVLRNGLTTLGVRAPTKM